jgi:hypothetical protein
MLLRCNHAASAAEPVLFHLHSIQSGAPLALSLHNVHCLYPKVRVCECGVVVMGVGQSFPFMLVSKDQGRRNTVPHIKHT